MCYYRRMSKYDTDILVWSAHQAELLRRMVTGEPVNEPPDWANIIEEVADVGRSSLRACRSLLFQSPAARPEGGSMAAVAGCAALAFGGPRGPRQRN